MERKNVGEVNGGGNGGGARARRGFVQPGGDSLEVQRGLRLFSRRCPVPTETSPDRWTPAGAFAVPPVPDVRLPSDDGGDGGGDDGGTADDPAEAANRDPLRRPRPRRRPETVRRRT